MTSDYREQKKGLLPWVFYILAALSMLGGTVLSMELWPGDPGDGYNWKTVAFIPSIVWFSAGIIECALFTAIGKVLFYLRQISFNTAINE